MAVCYLRLAVESKPYPVDFKGGQSFGEAHLYVFLVMELGTRRIPEPLETFVPPQIHDRRFVARHCRVAARAILGGLHHEYRWARSAA